MNLGNLFKRRSREEDYAREIRADLELEEEEQRQNGLAPEEARYAARRAFGNPVSVAESMREVWVRSWLERLLQDVRYGVRMLRRNPAFTAVAVLTLALGVGATSSSFSAVKAVLWAPLPFAHADRLVQIQTVVRQTQELREWAPYRDVADWRELNRSFESIGAQGFAILYLTGSDNPEGLYGARVSAEMFPTLGAEPLLGRNFLKEEDEPGRNRVVILSHELWVRRFGSDPGVIGRKVSLTGLAAGGNHVVVGVMPPGFNFPMDVPTAVNLPSRQMMFWVPNGINPMKEARDRGGLRVVGLLKLGVPVSRAQADLDRIAAQLERQYPQTNAGRGVRLVLLRDHIIGGARPAMLLLLGAVGLVVLIACVNIANLLLARDTNRTRETGIRLALGAGRLRIVRQLLTESLLLGLLGGGAGLLLAKAGLKVLILLAPRDIPRLAETRIDAGVLAFTLGLSLVAGILFGLLPALHAAGADVQTALWESAVRTTAGPLRSRLREALIVAEVALALILTAGAGLLVKSFVLLRGVDIGFRTERVLTAILLLPNYRYPDTPPKILFYRKLLENLRTTPGFVSAGAVDGVPLSDNAGETYIQVEGRASAKSGDERLQAEVFSASPDYLPTMGIPLVAGRELTPQDAASGSGAAIVNELAAKQFWPGEDPLGRRFRFDDSSGKNAWKRVVGVVKATRDNGLDQPAPAAVFVSMEEGLAPPQFLVARTSGPALEMAPALRRAVTALDKDQPLFFVTSMQDLVDSSVAQRRFSMTLLSGFGILALVLAAVGIYGVISYSVAQRTHEIGLRAALGARRGALLGLVLGRGSGWHCSASPSAFPGAWA